MSTRAQMQSFESVVVVIFVSLIIFIGLVFYVRVGQEDIKQEREEYITFEAIELLSLISSMPELRCSSYGSSDAACIDKYLLEAFNTYLLSALKSKDIPESLFYYNELFGDSRIEVHLLYGPEGPINQSVLIYARNLSQRQGVTPLRAPLHVFDPVDKTKTFAYVEVQKYS